MKRFIVGLIVTLIIIMSIPFTVFGASPTIKIGDYVVMGSYYNKPILWRCVDIDSNGPLMLSDKVISIKAFDAKGSHKYSDGTNQNDSYFLKRDLEGSNLWETSNLRSWLNSTAESGKVVWIDSCPPTKENVRAMINYYADEKGFLSNNNFNDKDIKNIKNVTQKSILNTLDVKKLSKGGSELHIYNDKITQCIQNYDISYFHNVNDKMFLLDIQQLYKVYSNRDILGSDYWKGYPTTKAFDMLALDKVYSYKEGDPVSYWLRTPYTKDDKPQYVREVYFGGGIYEADAFSANCGVRPAFYLDTSANADKLTGFGTMGSPYIYDYEVKQSSAITSSTALSQVNSSNMQSSTLTSNTSSAVLPIKSGSGNKANFPFILIGVILVIIIGIAIILFLPKNVGKKFDFSTLLKDKKFKIVLIVSIIVMLLVVAYIIIGNILDAKVKDFFNKNSSQQSTTEAVSSTISTENVSSTIQQQPSSVATAPSSVPTVDYNYLTGEYKRDDNSQDVNATLSLKYLGDGKLQITGHAAFMNNIGDVDGVAKITDSTHAVYSDSYGSLTLTFSGNKIIAKEEPEGTFGGNNVTFNGTYSK